MEIFGFAGRSATHQDLINSFHPEDLQKRNKAVEESFDKGSLEYEARIIQPGGNTRWIKVYGKIIHNGLRETLRMYGTVLDITDQRVILEELIRSETQFRLLADSMPQFVWTADVHGALNYFSKAVYDYTHAIPGEYEANGWIGIVHPEDWQANVEKWKDSLASGEEFIYEHRLKNYKGDYRWYLTRALPQKGNDGLIQRWVGTSTDIQDQKDLSDRLEKQVRERTKELGELNRHLLIKNNIFAQAEENAFIGSYSWNLHTSELEYSDNLFRLFGFEPGEFVPTFEKYLSLIHPDDKEQVKKDGEDTLARKELVAHTYRVITKNGTTRYFRSTGSMIGEGENLYLIGTVQDISQDKHYNDMLQSKNLELERSNSELESFNYIASHDLQEPLRKIQAFSQRIISKEDKKFSDFTRDYFNRIQSAAERMQNLIDALLSYSRINASNIPLEKTDLNLLLTEVLSDLQELVEDTGAVVKAGNLPEIKSLAIQVRQVFTNLISNAIKYRRPGVPPFITVTATRMAGKNLLEENADPALDYWNISITDNGIGFEQQYEAKIFELFQRLHGSNDYIGTGIGLAICKKIMRNHHGLISAIGRPGQGSTFNIFFPCSID
jgi:PAS domain S-box-containing protein